MSLLDSLTVALGSLRGNPLRSALTALGIVIGVAAVIAMVAVGTGAEMQVEKAVRNVGSNLLVAHNGSRAVAGRQGGQGSLLTLTESDIDALSRSISTVEVVAGSVAGTRQLVFGNRNWSSTVRGITPEYFLARNWTVRKGRNMTPRELRSAAKVVLLGQSVVDELFQGDSPLGQTVRIQRIPFTVIGVMAAKGNAPWGGDQDDVVYMPLSTAKKRLFGGRQARRDLVSQITIKALPSTIEVTEREVRKLLRGLHGLEPGEPDDFFLRSVAEVFEAKVASSRVMSRLLASVAGISLLVGGIGIMNIMLVSVAERTSEIGLRMAVGARPADIMRQFVIEALLLSVFGGLVGIALGIGGSIVISRIADWPVVIGPVAVLVAVVFSALVGVFFGYYPARKAARLDPIDALRQE